MGTPWPWSFITDWTLGRRPEEVYTLGSGTGMGKSDILYEVVASTIRGSNREGAVFPPEAFAIFGYESGPKKTKREILSKLAGKRFKVPQGHPKCYWTPADLDATKELLVDCKARGGRLYLMDSKGAPDWDRIKDLARFYHHAEGVTNFVIDPVSALVAGEDEERKDLDRIFKEAEDLAVELNSKVYFTSHLSRPKDGPSHEEGGHVRLGQFRGSNGIGMFSAFVLGLERNQQADTPQERCTATVRMVKDRQLGDSTGETSKLFYDRMSGLYDQAYEDLPSEEEPADED
jgi:twinkle protein